MSDFGSDFGISIDGFTRAGAIAAQAQAAEVAEEADGLSEDTAEVAVVEARLAERLDAGASKQAYHEAVVEAIGWWQEEEQQ